MIFGKYINIYYKKYWYLFLSGFLALVIVDSVQLFVPQLVAEIIEKVENYINFKNGLVVTGPIWGQNQNLYHVNDYLYYFGNLSLIVVCIGIMRSLWRLTLNRAQILVERDLRSQIFSHLETLSVNFYNQHKTGALMAYFTNDVESICLIFSDGIIFLVDIFVLGIVAFIKMMLVNYILTLIFIIPMVIFAFSSYYIEKGLSSRFERRQEYFEKLSDLVQENLSGISVIKAFVKEVSEMRNFARMNKDNKTVNLDHLKFSAKVDVLINALIYIVFLLIIVFGGIFVFNPSFLENIPGIQSMTASSLTELYGYYDTLIWPLIAIGMLINIMSKGRASLNRITVLLDTKNEVIEPSNEQEKDTKEFIGDIEFRNLSFKYPDEKENIYALKHINVSIKHGENIGVIGRTGSGKTTFINMLMKYFNVDRGMVFIDNKDINDWSKTDLRANIGYVAQDTFLFSDYIDNNISFDGESYTKEEIENAARFACVEDSILEFSDGYKTKIGERGCTLSGGQKQRISMARAIIKNPKILILDDSVSAVDSNTEKAILKNIYDQRKGKTTFVITHRVSAIEKMDHIIVLDDGEIVGYGNHKELINSCQVYKTICKLQSLNKEEENNG